MQCTYTSPSWLIHEPLISVCNTARLGSAVLGMHVPAVHADIAEECYVGNASKACKHKT